MSRNRNKNALVFAVLFALALVTVGCASGTTPPKEEWDKTFGGTEWDVANSVQQTSDGGYIIAGYTESYGAGGRDVWIIKTDSKGNKEWDRTFGGTDNDTAESVQQTSDGGYIVAGYTESYGAGGRDVRCSAGRRDVWLVKIDSDGNKQWDKTFGGTNIDVANSVQQTSDGGYILAGETSASCYTVYGTVYGDVWLVKTDSCGNKQWDKTFGGTGHDFGHSVQQTLDGGYIIAGYTGSYGAGIWDFWLVKTDSDGNKQWDKAFGGTDWDVANSVQQTSDGGYIIAGYTEPSGAGDEDFWLVKTDSNGNEQWNKTFGFGEIALCDTDKANSVQQTSDGGYIIAGDTSHFIIRRADSSYSVFQNGRHSDVWLVKTDADGNEQWNKTFGGTEWDSANSVQQTSDGGYIIAGGTSSYGNRDFWLIKLKRELTEPTKPTQTPVTIPGTIPAFEAIFAIAGLLAVAYLLRRRK